MKKVLALALAIMMLTALAAGCGGNDTPAQTAAPAPAQEPAASGEPAAQPSGDAPAVTSADKFSWNMSISSGETSTWMMGARKFAELVSEYSNGNITVTVFPSDALSGGNQSKGVEQLMTGATDLTFHSNAIYTVMDEKFGAISLPFLYSSPEEAFVALDGAGGEVYEKMLQEKGIKLLGFGENGMRQLTTNVPINNINDLKGLKIRCPNVPLWMETFQALGANPLAMNFSEVFTSLQQGTIDGQENPLDAIVSSNLQEVQKYFCMWNYCYDIIIFGMNQKLWESLPADYQAIVAKAGKEAAAHQVQVNREKNAEHLEFVESYGVTATYPDEAAMAEFRAAVQPVIDKYTDLLGEETMAAFKPAS